MAIKILKAALLVAILIQFIPLGNASLRTTGEPPWNSLATRALFRRACFDCYSERRCGLVTPTLLPHPGWSREMLMVVEGI